MPLHIVVEDGELLEFAQTLLRAANTWDPSTQPRWLVPLCDMVDRRLGHLVEKAASPATEAGLEVQALLHHL